MVALLDAGQTVLQLFKAPLQRLDDVPLFDGGVTEIIQRLLLMGVARLQVR